jgi:hypothetical protein
MQLPVFLPGPKNDIRHMIMVFGPQGVLNIWGMFVASIG